MAAPSTAVATALKHQSIELGWDALCTGVLPAGSFSEVVLRDGLPAPTAPDTLLQISDRLTSDGILRVLLPPDLGIRADVSRRLDAAGFDLCESLRGEALYAPTWSGHHLIETPADSGSQTVVVLSSDGPLSPEIVMGYRAALGSDVHVVIEEAVTGDVIHGLCLVTSNDIIPEPRWIRALMKEYEQSQTAVGCALADMNGIRLHVGADQAGHAWASGSASHHPLLSYKRTAALLPPFLLPPGEMDSGSVVNGTLLSSVVAISAAPWERERSTLPTCNVLGNTVLVVADELGVWSLLERQADLTYAPGTWIRAQQGAGNTVVLSASEFFDPWVRAELAGVGVVLNDETRDATVGELAQLLQPECIAFASNQRLESEFALLTRVASGAETSWIGTEMCARPERIDAVGRGSLKTETFTSDIPRIDPVEIVEGLTSIVIPVYGMWSLTEQCLASIRESTLENYEIIVVDDCSPDETARELAKADVIVVSNKTNLGFPGAVNAGLERSVGEFVCVLNNDTEVTANWLSEMHAALSHDDVGMVGPRSNSITGRQAVPKTPSLSEPDRAHRWAKLWSSMRMGVSWPTNTLIGFCLLSRRGIYEELGGFEQGYGHGNFEDLDMSLRIRDAGYTLQVADASVVLHHGSATFNSSGIDLDALMHQTHQRFGDRDIFSGGLLTVIVLSDGDGEVARKSAASAVTVADQTILLERGCLFDAEILTSAGGIVGVHSTSLDWADGEQLGDFIAGLTSDWILVLGAGEELMVNEWGKARSELHGRPSGSVGIKTPTGPQIRVHTPNSAAIQVIGIEAENPLQRIVIRQAV